MNDEQKLQLPIILSYLEDSRRIVEGGKNRRWGVFKWIIALNILLTTAVLTRPALHESPAPLGIWCTAIVVSVMGYLLISHYDYRMNRARDRIRNLTEWIRDKASIDMYSTMGDTEQLPSWVKDIHERTFFFIAIAISFAAVTVATYTNSN